MTSRRSAATSSGGWRGRTSKAGLGDDGATAAAEEPVLGRDEIRRRAREDFNARQVVNGGIDHSVRIDSPVIQMRSELDRRPRRDRRRRSTSSSSSGSAATCGTTRSSIVDLTYSDPDPTLLF